jgi:hypothetical protein
LGNFFAWIVTSVDVGFRKPVPEFFDFALRKCGLGPDEVLFVGNQLNAATHIFPVVQAAVPRSTSDNHSLENTAVQFA